MNTIKIKEENNTHFHIEFEYKILSKSLKSILYDLLPSKQHNFLHKISLIS